MSPTPGRSGPRGVFTAPRSLAWQSVRVVFVSPEPFDLTHPLYDGMGTHRGLPGHARFYSADPFGNRLEFLQPHNT